MNNSNASEKELFLDALELPIDQRATYLQAITDTDLRGRVEALIGAIEDGPTKASAEELSITDGEGAIIDRYKVLQKIGEGGFGVVYMAEQQEPVTRRVALKVIKLGMDTKEVIARFEAERQALAMMDHPNIAKVLDAGTTESGRPYFVMELVKGISIIDFCDGKKMATQQRLSLFTEVCSAVQHAHHKGIIHRDIKPSNIMVTLHDGMPVAKVIDFGIAKATQQRLTDKTLFTRFEQFVGTPAYMSPEQAEMSGLDIDTRTDIYSLGVLLYELLTGKTPFDAKELLAAGYDEMRRRIKEDEPIRPSTRLHSLEQGELTSVANARHLTPEKLHLLIRGELDWIVGKALEKDRSRRYETVDSFRLDVQRYLDDEPVAAAAPNKIYQLKKLVRRHSGLVASVATIVAILILATIISLIQTFQATEAKLAARESEKAANHERDRAIEAEGDATKARALAQQQAENAKLNYYVSTINRAYSEIQKTDFFEAEMLLNGLVPGQGDKDLRGFEWYLLKGRSKPNVHSEIQIQDPETSKGGNYSPDAISVPGSPSTVAIGNNSGEVSFWNVDTGRKSSVFKAHDHAVRGLSISHDGNYLATSQLLAPPYIIRVWELQSETPNLIAEFPVEPIGGRAEDVKPIRFSPVQNIAAIQQRDPLTPNGPNDVHLWNPKTKKVLKVLKGGGTPMAFNHDGSTVVTGFMQNGKMTASLWDIASGDLLGQRDDLAKGQVVFSPQGNWIAGDGDPEGYLFCKDFHSPPVKLLPGLRLKFIPGKDQVLCAKGRYARLYDLNTWEPLATFSTGGEFIYDWLVLDDGGRIAVAGDEMLRTYEIAESRIKPYVIDDVGMWGFSPSGSYLGLTKRLQGPVVIDLETKKPVYQGNEDQHFLAFTDDAILVQEPNSSGGQQVRLIDWKESKLGPPIPIEGSLYYSDIAVDAEEGLLVVIPPPAHLMQIYDYNTGKLIYEQEYDRPTRIRRPVFALNGQTLVATTQYPSQLLTYDTSTWNPIKTSPMASVTNGTMLPTDNEFLLIDWRGNLQVFDTATLSLTDSFRVLSGSTISALSPDKRTLALPSYDGLSLWNMETKSQLLFEQVGYGTAVCQFSPDNQWLGTSLIDFTKMVGRVYYGKLSIWHAPRN